jgi:hypothetical protein
MLLALEFPCRSNHAKEMEAAFVKGPLELHAGRILAELELRAEIGR